MITFSFYTIILLVTFLVFFVLWYYKKVGRMAHYLAKCPCIPRTPFLGNLPFITGGIFKGIPAEISVFILQGTLGYTLFFKDFYVFWIGWNPLIVLYKPEYVEIILSSNKLIEKSYNYDLLHPWLGKGLLTNKGDAWRARRKFLTPAFHFKIIDDFMPVMSEHSMTFVERLKEMDGQTIDISPLVTSCTLDIICDTAMGIKIDAQKNPNSEYVQAIYCLGEVFMQRTFDVKGWFDFIFHRTAYGKQYLKSLHTLHDFTRKVIRDRKQELINREKSELQNNEDELGRKKRMAFLNLLLEHHLSTDSQLTEEDIREEVDTFMFEGHDTTAMAISWSLHLIGLDPEVQRKVHEEIQYVFGDDKTRPVIGSDVKELKYLECCIKEALRLFPSVPMIARLASEDFQLKSYTIPKGSTIIIYPYVLHRNEEVFPQSEVYRPERFIEDKKSETRINPYSYVPFSAGPRNCIGQKFALNEEKIVLANLFRNFKIKSMDYRDNVRVAMELVTRPRDPIRMQFQPK